MTPPSNTAYGHEGLPNYQFGFDYSQSPLGEGLLTEWNDRTARAAHLGANKDVKQMMRLLGAPE